MVRKLHFKALLPPSIDLPSIWERIPNENTHLGGENGKYTVIFHGEISEGLSILEVILKEVDEYEVNLRTFGEAFENGEKEEETAREAQADSV